MPLGVRRKDVDDARDQIEAWLIAGVPRLEIARRLDCRYATLYTRLDAWGLLEYKNPGCRGIASPLRKNSSHFLGVDGAAISSHKLKLLLWSEGLKPRHCEKCGWAEVSIDGRLPLELDHINGERYDNRLENLRILCPNCHSLEPTSSARKRNKSV